MLCFALPQLTHLSTRTKSTVLGASCEYVSGVKGPGQVVGEISLDTECSSVHRHSARAVGPVVVIKLTEENFIRALLHFHEGNCEEVSASHTDGAAGLHGASAVTDRLLMVGSLD